MKKAIIVILILLAIGGGVWFYIRNKSINTKHKAMLVIDDYTGVGVAALESMDESYLISRAKAIKSGSDTFQDQGGTYDTKTGRKVF